MLVLSTSYMQSRIGDPVITAGSKKLKEKKYRKLTNLRHVISIKYPKPSGSTMISSAPRRIQVIDNDLLRLTFGTEPGSSCTSCCVVTYYVRRAHWRIRVLVWTDCMYFRAALLYRSSFLTLDVHRRWHTPSGPLHFTGNILSDNFE